MIENSIAIVVSCMPAAAGFAKAHIAQSSFIKSLRSTLFSRNTDSGVKSMPSGGSKDNRNNDIVTFGQGNDRAKGRPERGQRDYLELTDMMQSVDDVGNLRPKGEVQWTTAVTSAPVAPSPRYGVSDGAQGILQTTEFMQQYHSTESGRTFGGVDGVVPQTHADQDVF